MSEIGKIFDGVEAEVRRAHAEGLDAVEQIVGRIRRYERSLAEDPEAVAAVEAAEEVVEEHDPTLVERIEKATSHVDLHAIATELGLEVPADVKADWGDAHGVPAKKAVLTAKAEEIAGASEPEPTP